MSKEEIELTAYCGLYCGDCIRYRSKAIRLAEDLARELEEIKFAHYTDLKRTSVKEFEHYNEFCEVLDAIAKLQCDVPCRAGGDGCSQPCEIKKCAQLNNFQGCWECDGFETCEKFEFLKPFHGETPRENLRKMREYGLDRWVIHRGKCYPWLS
jgi:hypothetical protein